MEPIGILDPQSGIDAEYSSGIDWEDDEGLRAYRDSLNPESQFEFAMVEAEFAAAEEARATARRLVAIQSALQIARGNPETFVGPGCGDGKQAREFAERAAIAELAVTLSVSENVVRDQLALADNLTQRLPRLWEAFRDGEISFLKVRAMSEVADTLPHDRPEVIAEFDRQMAEAARLFTVTKLRAKARVLRERLHTESAETRHAKARSERYVSVENCDDGMAWLHALLPAEAAHRAYARLDANAKHLAAAGDEQRTLPQLRSDVLADLLTGDGTEYAVRATVNLTVPVLTLLGTADSAEDAASEGAASEGAASDTQRETTDAGPAFTRMRAVNNPALLNGCVPIDPETARRLCVNAPSIQRILTDPIDGAVLTVGRSSYRPPADLARFTRARYPVCAFPGCARRAETCDLDHVCDWCYGNDTAHDNLIPLCRHHHRLKHNTRWRVQYIRGNDTNARPSIRWTSPTGIHHDPDPPPW